MSILRFIPELPLLRRELTELSNRRRTYIIRFVGAIVVLSVVMVLFQRQISLIGSGAFGPGTFRGPGSGMPYNPNKFFGTGGMIFQSIVPMLFHAVQLLMPALICGAITLEKERNTLGTLFVTRLSPMTIVLEKLGSRLVPMFTFLLLTFPLLAFVYSLGGVDTTMLISTLWLLFCECLLYACIGLMFSSFFATTVTAFIWSYVLTGLLVMCSLILHVSVLTPFDVWLSSYNPIYFLRSGQSWFLDDMFTASIFAGMPGTSGASGSWQVLSGVLIRVGASLPSLIVSLICLVLARVFLIRRAFVSSSSILLKLFKRVDTFFTKLNDRTTGGVVLIKDRDSLPLFDPVAWRERSKKSLGKARYLIRILIVLEGPILFICLATATASQTTDFSGLRGLLLFMWGLAALIIAVKASTLISSERARETLEALLSTPLTAKEILTQKIAGMKRLMLVLAIPVLTIHFTILLMHFDFATVILRPTMHSTMTILSYSVMVVLTTWTVMHLLAWLSVLLGLRSTTQSKSVMTAITVIAAWVLISGWIAQPGGFVHEVLNRAYLGDSLPDYSDRYGRRGFSNDNRRPDSSAAIGFMLCTLRPDGGIQANESILVAATGGRVRDNTLTWMLSGNSVTAFMASVAVLVAQFLLLLLLKTFTLRLAPRLLQRRDQQLAPSRSFEPALDPFAAAAEVIA